MTVCVTDCPAPSVAVYVNVSTPDQSSPGVYVHDPSAATVAVPFDACSSRAAVRSPASLASRLAPVVRAWPASVVPASSSPSGRTVTVTVCVTDCPAPSVAV